MNFHLFSYWFMRVFEGTFIFTNDELEEAGL